MEASWRKNDRSGGRSQQASTLEIQPDVKTRSIGPRPTTWYAIERPSTVFA